MLIANILALRLSRAVAYTTDDISTDCLPMDEVGINSPASVNNYFGSECARNYAKSKTTAVYVKL